MIGGLPSRAYERGGKGAVTRVADAHEGSGGILVFHVAQSQGPGLIAVWQSADLASTEALVLAERLDGVG